MPAITSARVVAIATTGILIGGIAGVAHGSLFSRNGGAVKEIHTVASSDPFALTEGGGSYTSVPGAQLTIGVPTGATELLDIRYTAESVCVQSNMASNGYCSVRILVDGVEPPPASGPDFAFDSSDKGHEGAGSLEAHAMERSVVVGQGAHTVVVQARLVNGATGFQLDDWHLAVDVATVP